MSLHLSCCKKPSITTAEGHMEEDLLPCGGPCALGRDLLSSSLEGHQDLLLPQAANERVEGRYQKRASCQSQARVNRRLSRR